MTTDSLTVLADTLEQHPGLTDSEARRLTRSELDADAFESLLADAFRHGFVLRDCRGRLEWIGPATNGRAH